MAFDPLRFANEMSFRQHFEVTAQDFESMKTGAEVLRSAPGKNLK